MHTHSTGHPKTAVPLITQEYLLRDGHNLHSHGLDGTLITATKDSEVSSLAPVLTPGVLDCPVLGA